MVGRAMRSNAGIVAFIAAVAGCGSAGPGACESIAAPTAPAAQVAAIATSETSEPASAVASHQSGASFKLELTYAQKILVPRGSGLDVKIHDATGKTVFTRKTTTGQDIPPYVIKVAINQPVTFPLTVDAKLVSRIGHHFGESVEITESGAQGPKPVEILMKPE
jgi:hypothetical protein